ncbi:MAG: SRPBCC family protein [Myxococcales bacterium]
MRAAPLLAPLLLAAASAWRPAGKVDGVRLELRDVPGSGYQEIRAETESAASLSGLCDAVFGKGEDAVGPQRFKHREVIRETETDRWTYEQIGVPVVADRDYVMHVRRLQPAASGRCEIAFHTETLPGWPPRPGFVRIPLIRGSWLLEPEAAGKVRVRYQVFSDPGGGLPAFLVGGAQRRAAIDFLRIILSRAR